MLAIKRNRGKWLAILPSLILIIVIFVFAIMPDLQSGLRNNVIGYSMFALAGDTLLTLFLYAMRGANHARRSNGRADKIFVGYFYIIFALTVISALTMMFHN